VSDDNAGILRCQADVNQLRTELAKRSYPRHILPDVRYEGKERQLLLQRLQSRKLQSRSQQVQDGLLVFKIDFSEEIKQFRLKTRIEEVLKQLRVQIGCNFLQDARIVVAHTV